MDVPHHVADIFLCHALGIDLPALIREPDVPLPPAAEKILADLLARRCAGEPTAYLLGEREFYGRSFAVAPSTLIPRPESELLIDEALTLLPDASLSFVDLGTGSGCLAITLAVEKPAWTGLAVDISPDALNIARQNACRLGAERLNFLHADFTRPDFFDVLAQPMAALPLDICLVISNPPYVSEAGYRELDAGIRLYEPRQDLVSGDGGLEHLRVVIGVAGRILCSGGILIMEHGMEQGEDVRSLCVPNLWREVRTRQDMAGRNRCLVAVRRQM